MDSIISVSLLIFRDERILFLKEMQDRIKYILKLPGGRVEDGEDIEECTIRYIKDTVGIDIELDRTLGGIITRKNKQGKFLITFVFLAEAMDRGTPVGAAYIPYRDVEYYYNITEFSKLIVNKLRVSAASEIRSRESMERDGKKYLMYF